MSPRRRAVAPGGRDAVVRGPRAARRSTSAASSDRGTGGSCLPRWSATQAAPTASVVGPGVGVAIGLAARHDERVPAGRALHGRTALGDAIVLELVFGLTAIAANIHEPSRSRPGGRFEARRSIPRCIRLWQRGRGSVTSSRETAHRAVPEAGVYGTAHHQVPQMIDQETTIERTPEHQRRCGRGADHRGPPGQARRHAVDQGGEHSADSATAGPMTTRAGSARKNRYPAMFSPPDSAW